MSQPYPELTVADLSLFSGRPADSYENVEYIPVALDMAILMFKVATCLTALPDDPIFLQLAHTGILALADDFYLKQPNAEMNATPFNSESIGSYSYSKVGTGSAKMISSAVQKGEATGIPWFDLAVDRMGACESFDGFEMTGGIDVFAGHRPLGMDPRHERVLQYLGPEEQNRFFGYEGVAMPGVMG